MTEMKKTIKGIITIIIIKFYEHMLYFVCQVLESKRGRDWFLVYLLVDMVGVVSLDVQGSHFKVVCNTSLCRSL